ncbi:stalk domain-containing protein [Paenibacillus sp. MMO-177]|uniref:stalk domain-containing protein n=1 Tax=Paenibacillus sp. MMO-177 TaxID=3081289 RepID=UPI0030183189
MKKKVFILVTTLALIGATTVFASDIKKIVLTTFTSPIIVDNQKYSKTDLPILSYKDNTYVPLREVGNLLGANVKWNSSKKQIEINSDTFLLNESEYGMPENEFVNLINELSVAINEKNTTSYFSHFTKQAQTNFPKMPEYKIKIVNHYIFENVTLDNASVKVDVYFTESPAAELMYTQTSYELAKENGIWKITGWS